MGVSLDASVLEVVLLELEVEDDATGCVGSPSGHAGNEPVEPAASMLSATLLSHLLKSPSCVPVAAEILAAASCIKLLKAIESSSDSAGGALASAVGSVAAAPVLEESVVPELASVLELLDVVPLVPLLEVLPLVPEVPLVPLLEVPPGGGGQPLNRRGPNCDRSGI